MGLHNSSTGIDLTMDTPSKVATDISNLRHSNMAGITEVNQNSMDHEAWIRPLPLKTSFLIIITAAHAPPQGMVSFGQGAPEEYAFQYSNCTGRRKALLIGINYFGQEGQLRGCINDVHNVSTYLTENFGYARDDMVILTDDQQNQAGQPTKNNILRAMAWLVRDVQTNDSLFFHYSGTNYIRSQSSC